MADGPAHANVEVVLPSSATVSPQRRGPVKRPKEYEVLVPIPGELFDGQPGFNGKRFVRTALALAADNDGRVVLFGTVPVDGEDAIEHIRAYTDEAKAETIESEAAVVSLKEHIERVGRIAEIARSLGIDVPISAIVQPVLDTTSGILTAIDHRDSSAVLLLGDSDLDTGGIFSRSTVETIQESADCDVFVEHIGTHDGSSQLYVPDVTEHRIAPVAQSDSTSLDSILLVDDDGPHATLATEGARAVALAVDASVTVLRVIDPQSSERERSDAKERMDFTEFVLDEVPSITGELRETSDATETILNAASEHDLTVIGATGEQSMLQQLVAESVPETLAKQTELTVLVAQDSNEITRELFYDWQQNLSATEET